MVQVEAVVAGPVDNDLRARRQRLGLTADDLAAELGVHRTSVLRWERGVRLPGPGTMRGLAATLGCDLGAVAAFFDSRRTPAAPRERLRATGLRTLRSRRGARADDVAGALGVPASTVYNWEQGRAGLPVALLGPLSDWSGLETDALVELLGRQAPVASGSTSSTLSRVRRRRGWSQARLAEEVGVSRGLVGDWERGRRTPELFQLRLLARALGQPVSSLAADFGVQAPAILDPRSWTPGDLPDVLRVLRSWSGLRQRDVAERCGCSSEAVRAWERGRSTPRPRTQSRLEQLYRLPPGSLDAAAPTTCRRDCAGHGHGEGRCPRHRRER